jgi:putative ABC transport system permease protein
MIAGRVPLARRNLFQERRRSVLAFGGVGASLLLVLLLQGILAGAMRQVTAYIRTSRADVVVSQRGVRTMHMSTSALAPDLPVKISALPGVLWAEGIRYSTVLLSAPRGGRQLSYVIGYDAKTGRAGPRSLVAGRAPRAGEIVLDRLGAQALSVGVGDRVMVFGNSFVVSGLSHGGTSMVTSTAFISTTDFAAQRGDALSYVMVRGAPGTSPEQLVRTIEGTLPVTAQTKTEFARQEARIVADMSADVLGIITTIGLGIALAVISLLLYSVTLSRLREFGVLKALGATSRRVLAVVTTQVLWTVAVSIVTAVALVVLVGGAITRVAPTIDVTVRANDVLRTTIDALVVATLGAIVPLRRVLRVDPASAFRRMS